MIRGQQHFQSFSVPSTPSGFHPECCVSTPAYQSSPTCPQWNSPVTSVTLQTQEGTQQYVL